ncbi:MAG TPA: hypothetical protein VFQ54_08810 [Thermomicrobiales bacterium]|nr:hypothetical protein [Thermomicrobiales bacterium]
MSNHTNQILQEIAYSAIGLTMIVIGLAFAVRRKQYSFGSILIFTGAFIIGFAFYVSQANNLVFDDDSPEMDPAAYGTPAFGN